MSIFGNNGKGSLISYLRKKLWCSNIFLSSESDLNNSLYNMFRINLTLTNEGYEHQQEVADVVFSYINLIKREGQQKWFYDELQQIERTNFR